MSIRDLDRDHLWEEFIVSHLCKVNYHDHIWSKKQALTREILESHLDEIVSRIEKLRHWIGHDYKFGDEYLDVNDVTVGYQILACLILKTGAILPDIVKKEALKSTTVEYDKKWDWPEDIKEIRRFCLDEFREKLLIHQPGMKHRFIIFNFTNYEDFKKTCIGLDQFYKYIRSNKIKSIPYVNLDCSNLYVFPPEILELVHLKSLSLNFNHLTTLPEEISRLTSLERLSLRNNNIDRLPRSFKGLPSTLSIDLSGNPIRESDNYLNYLTPKKAEAIRKARRQIFSKYEN